ncbi:hypothetical protein D3C84_1191340 [compost metagenome]
MLERANERFEGQEYLGLYPAVSKEDLEDRPDAANRLRGMKPRQPFNPLPFGGIGKPRF